ncbi:hypothetical protein DICVIV_05707 [Dictyocaulus viviparus]|uniref:Uncharacterized protein n=1 Tax=Dictyocaulus viviparus TaxID=29172 RepID=A0A0D8XWQ6_DICVI|nr:hypothetical protein DICVIV_05707 [Dictyocaulus viviparus]
MRAARNCNSGPSYRYSFAPPPTAPTLEITINQNAAGPSQSSYTKVESVERDRLLVAAPQPPSSGYEQPAYNPMWFDPILRKENWGIFRLCLFELVLAVVILAGGIWCYRETFSCCPYYSSIWTSFIFIINSLVGSAAAKIGTVNLYVAHLVLSFVSILAGFISGGLSVRNWLIMGTYHQRSTVNREEFCLLDAYNPRRISYIYSKMSEYDFSNCLWRFKVAVAMTTVQFFVTLIEGL